MTWIKGCRSMKKSHLSTYPLFVWGLIFFFVLLPLLLFCGFGVYGIWTTNLPPDWGNPFPEGTQIIQQTDTHQGVFRRKGIRVVAAQVPETCIQQFGNRLRDEGFISGRPLGLTCEQLDTIEAARDILDAPNTLYNFDDGAIAFIEEPCSDWAVAVYDLDTGLFCYIEYDS